MVQVFKEVLLDEMKRQSFIEQLNKLGVFKSPKGNELHTLTYAELHRQLVLAKIRKGL